MGNTSALAIADVISLAEVAAKRAVKFAAMIDTLEAGPAARAAEVGRSLSGVGMPRRDLEAAVAKAEVAARTEVQNNSSDARWHAIKELVASAESLASTAGRKATESDRVAQPKRVFSRRRAAMAQPSKRSLPMPDPALSDNTLDIPLSTVPILTVADVISLAEVAARRAEKFGATIDTLTKGVAARASEVQASLLNADFPRRDIDAAVAKAAAKARAEVTANSSDARWTALRELDAAAASLETTAQLYANPVAVLARAGIGSVERTNFLTQLQGAGPVELRQMALLAASTGNKVMGAAIVSIIDRMPRKDRPFSAADLAERLVGEETRKVQVAIAAVRHAVQASIVHNRVWEAGKASGLDRLKLALNNPNRKEA